MTTPAQSTPSTSIHPDTEMGLLALSVSDLARSLAYYTDAIGFQVLHQDENGVTLGAGARPLLLLTHQPGAKAWPRGGRSYTGLYHFAILLPTRADLGRWLKHWIELGLPVPGQGDHIVSEALYLDDPDGHGIEIYADRPRETWQVVNGQIRMGTGPVDIRGLLQEAARSGHPWTGLPPGTRLGHMHLQVGDIAGAERFYHDILGFDIMAKMPTALFLSAGGYHHHLGTNTWHSQGASATPTDSVKLHFFTINLPSGEALHTVLERLEAAGVPYGKRDNAVILQDPWATTVLLQVGGAADAEAARSLLKAWTA
jgi:catechol 2,3-dioxygenase